MNRRSLLLVGIAGCLWLALTACQPDPIPTATGTGAIEVSAVAGPVCPVDRNPPDPGCEPRPVQGARILVQPGDGRDIVVGEATSDADGRATVQLPAGEYVVVGADVEGLMGRPAPVRITVPPGGAVTVELVYDTGIR